MGDITEIILEYISTKPEVESIFLYGSKFSCQPGIDNSKSQFDILLKPTDYKKWNQLNLEKNPQDYCYLGRKILESNINIINIFNSEMMYFFYLPYKGYMFKIAVFSQKQFDTLRTFDSFFLAGRFQKPIKILKSSLEDLETIKYNQKNALLIGLLLLKEGIFTEEDLYKQICSLSYLNDVRKYGFEANCKVNSLVKGNIDFFRSTYRDDNLWQYNSHGIIDINDNELMKSKFQLPSAFLKAINEYQTENGYQLTETECILKWLKEQNFFDNITQLFKATITSGPNKILKYGYEKHQKYKNSNLDH